MSESDLYDLVIQAQQGDEQAMMKIVGNFKPLIRKVLLTTDPNDRHDLEQMISIRMINTIKTYDVNSTPDLSALLKKIDKWVNE